MTVRTALLVALALALPGVGRAQSGALDLSDPPAAVASLERAVETSDGIGVFAHQDIHTLHDGLKDRALRLRLLKALAAGGFESSDPFLAEDELWESLLLMQVADGAPTAQVLATLKRIRGVEMLLLVRLDPRLAAARRLDEAWFEPDTVVMRALAQADRLFQKHPDRLAGVRLRADLLERLGRPAEALRLTDNAIARAAVSPTSFMDIDSALTGVRVERALSLWQLGRFDEAIVEDRRIVELASAEKDYKGWAHLQLVRHLAAVRRGAEALDALDYFKYRDDAETFDMATAYSVCVNAQLGRLFVASSDRTDLESRDDSANPALTYALLCANDIDAAAESYKARLAEVGMRAWTISALSARKPPLALAPGEAMLLDRQAAVAARPDVQEALVKVGGARATWLVPSGPEIY
jgi:tetratricopeptide (TPR) repeat protein